MKVMLMQPNFQLLGKRSWKLIPYGLCLLKACCCDEFDVTVYDPNFANESEEDIKRKLLEFAPVVVGITSFSTEYVEEINLHVAFIKETLPASKIILGGTLPTVWLGKAMANHDIEYFIAGEGEVVLKHLFRSIANKDAVHAATIPGVACWRVGEAVVNERPKFLDDLDSLPFPDYSDLDLVAYGNVKHKFAHTLISRQTPYATTITSRGCPLKCTFCAASTVSGKKVRLRSAANVLAEIAELRRQYGINEIIFLDDHFLFNRQRALDIMRGISDNFPGMTWKCCNVAVFSLDQELLEEMVRSGCNQITLSIESGDADVLKRLIKKPVDLEKARQVANDAKALGMEVISNFVIGIPGETWEQIRTTFRYAESLDIDMCNFHIATPLPKTELMQICIEHGLFKSEDDVAGYTIGAINTPEFTGMELQILRTFEWDRINFATPEKAAVIGKLEGLSTAEVATWRTNTRRSLGNTHRTTKS